MSERTGIDLVDVIEIVGNFKRPLIEGQAILDANHIITCGIVSRSKKIVILQALCLQTSDLKGMPHQIKVEIKLINNNKQFSCDCTCKAGKCKHIIATLLYVFRHRIENLEQLSTTDVRQKWGQLKKEKQMYDTMVPISQFCHMKKTSSGTYLDSRLGRTADADVLDILLSGSHNSELYLSLQSVPVPLPPDTLQYEEEMLQLSLCHSVIGNNKIMPFFVDICCLTDFTLEQHISQFYKSHVEMTYNNSIELYISTVNQTGDLWRNLRRVRITGTSCYNLFTYSNNQYPDWARRIDRLYNSAFKGNIATFHGKKYESEAIKVYEEITGNKVEHLGLIIPYNAPWLAVSLDGIVSGNCCVEVKCPLAGRSQSVKPTENSLKYLSIGEGDCLTLKKNHPYYGQVQLQMLLSGVQMCHFVIYCPHDKSMLINHVPFDANFMKTMLGVLARVFCKILPILYQLNS